jgi:hypothetical protein
MPTIKLSSKVINQVDKYKNGNKLGQNILDKRLNEIIFGHGYSYRLYFLTVRKIR